MRWLIAACCVAVCWLIVECALTVRAARRAADDAVMLIDWHAAEIERRADERLGDAITMLDRRLASIEQRADARLAGAVASSERQVASAVERADARLAETLAEVRALSSEAQATVAEARALIADARPGVQAWSSLSPHLAANALGAVAAIKITAGQAAHTMREIERATPDIVASLEASALASQQAAQSAAQTSQNLAVITKPGPRWLRYLGLGLGVAAPAAQTALPFVIRRAELR